MTIQRLRLLAPSFPPEAEDEADGWRDHLRLFAYAWLTGFLFFLILIA